MKDAEAVTLATSRIDRASHLRGNAEAQTALAADPRAGVLFFWRGRPLLTTPAEGAPRLAWQPFDTRPAADPAMATVFLGLEDGAPRFARVIPEWAGAPATGDGFAATEPVPHPDLPAGTGFTDLRASMAALDAAEAGAAAAAKGILGWHATHGFCAACGAKSEAGDSGWRRVCPACGTHHFPRTDPVVIMLILSGDSVLLGRSPGWPPGMYSLLAGFMEPGKSIEAAVRRETFEEAGVPVAEVEYLSSQPWPFPSSLMIGCRGRATDRTIRRDPVELEDARWATRTEVLTAIETNDPTLRPARRGSIARFLIDRWLAGTLD